MILGLLCSTAARGQETCLLIPLSLEERVQAAEVVVEGKVTAQRSFWDDQHHNIYTAHQVEVYKVFKGSPTTSTVEIITEGGQVGLDIHVYSATLQLKPQQQGIFFLQAAKKGAAQARYSVFGSMQGFIKYRLSEGTAHDPFQQYASIPLEVYGSLARLSGSSPRTVKANTALEAALAPPKTTSNQRRLIPLITNLSPLNLRAGTGDVLTITGSNFGSTRGSGYVEFRNADDGGKTFVKPLNADYLSWTDTEIKVKVPSYGIDGGTAGSGVVRVINSDPNTATSALSLTIIYAHSNVGYESEEQKISMQSVQPRLIAPNGQGGGYLFRFGASFESNTPALYAFKRAMNEWSCKTYINWNTVSNAAVANTAEDNINSVRFANSGELPTNVLGRTISRYRGCILNGTTVNFWVREIDMEFSPRSDWQYGPDAATNRQFDFQSVVVHELGHAHQLSHLILPRAVMHYAVAAGQVSRTLSPESDIAGGNYVMAQSATLPPCNVNPMKPRTANDCAIPVELIELTAQLTGTNQVLLQWNTKQETGLTEFVVERSGDGVSYTAIGRVPGSGTSTTPRSYTFTDPAPLPQLNYYRLRLVKTTGTQEFSEVVQIAGPSFVRQLAPNPGGNQTTLYFNPSEVDVLHMAIYNVAGQLYREWSLTLTPGSNKYDFTLFPSREDEKKNEYYPVRRGLFLIKWSTSRESGVIRYLKLE
ncbi:IPT/TIG domain-containing protein [Rufibacter glacialis]|uniref:IPT/TIG domain-containing protein n=1 Tax=Rufibacter glacialis TaxID=1259555 RepID=A0ABV4RJW0_9BACT|nr:IPT/TIG domain-containing protein [Rufibacter glacialis]